MILIFANTWLGAYKNLNTADPVEIICSAEDKDPITVRPSTVLAIQRAAFNGFSHSTAVSDSSGSTPFFAEGIRNEGTLLATKTPGHEGERYKTHSTRSMIYNP